MDHLNRRLCVDHMNDEYTDALCEVDVAMEVLEKMDEDEVKAAQTEARKRRTERSAFLSDYTARQRAVRPAPEPAKSKGRGKGRGGGKGGKGAGKGAAAPKLDCALSQATAKRFVLPGGSIWRGLTRGEWCCHMPPVPRIKASWSQEGQEGSMKSVLSRLWRLYADKEALEFPVCCPHADILGLTPAPAPRLRPFRAVGCRAFVCCVLPTTT